MKRRTFLAAMALSVPGFAVLPSAYAPAHATTGHYIVTLTPGVSPAVVAAAAGAVATHTYTNAINGFAAELSAAQLAALRSNPAVSMVEPDLVASANATEPTVHSGWDTWGLDRIDQRNLPLSTTYTYNSNGSGVHVYMFDSGIRYSHVEFGGRASKTFDAFGGDGSDCDGHGTHTAGTVGGGLSGQTTGVASGVTLHSVRVLDCTGNGPVSGILAAIDHVIANHASNAVANMSIGLNGRLLSFETAVRNLINSGVVTVVAAGNARQDACLFSPSAVTEAIVVAASTSTDRRASFSNKGACVDLYAPGAAVWSAWHTGDGALARLDGTSMAAPHVAGVAARYKQVNPGATHAQVHDYIVNNATNGVISQNPAGTPNKLLYADPSL